MFMLCRSRGPPALQSSQNQNHLPHKQVKGGYLLRYRRNFFCKGWNEEWMVLYDDSTLAWYTEKGRNKPRGYIRISDAPDLLAVGEWTLNVPRFPPFPRDCHIGQLLAIGVNKSPPEVQWLMAQSQTEISDWMTAISNTLPPPPHLPLEDKRLSLVHSHPRARPPTKCNTSDYSSPKNMNNGKTNPAYGADHTVLSGVAIDWGHGWGWGQSPWNAHATSTHDAALNNVNYHHTTENYTMGCEEVDWTAFGDFCF